MNSSKNLCHGGTWLPLVGLSPNSSHRVHAHVAVLLDAEHSVRLCNSCVERAGVHPSRRVELVKPAKGSRSRPQPRAGVRRG